MPDSNITKKALATALKELMHEVPFERINVAHICEKCDMNRKSFYYHFKDKYDLVNWIFDTEFLTLAKDSVTSVHYDERWAVIERVCIYFYNNRSFYRKALKINGQNSFSDHLREYAFPLLKIQLSTLIGDDHIDDFAVSFFADATVCAIERWLMDKESTPPEQFVAKLKDQFQRGTVAVYQQMNPEK